MPSGYYLEIHMEVVAQHDDTRVQQRSDEREREREIERENTKSKKEEMKLLIRF